MSDPKLKNSFNGEPSVDALVYHHSYIARTELMYAAAQGRLDLVGMLLKRGADVNIVDALGYRALDLAAGSGNKAVVELLLQHGAAVNDRTLAAAAGTGHEDIVQLLLEKGAVASQYALQTAATGGHLRIIKTLILNGVVPDSSDLAAASRCGRIDVVTFLLEKGVVADNASLIGAVRGGQTEIAVLLLKNGAPVDADAEPANGRTVLMEAAAIGNKQLIKLLLDNGASINKPNSRGETALMFATSCGQEGIIRLLLENSADPLQQDNAGRTALSITNEFVKVFTDSRLLKDNAALLEQWPKIQKQTPAQAPKKLQPRQP